MIAFTRPDPALTPGVYGTAPVPRDVPGSLKRRVFRRYGIGLLRHVLYTVDHLVPLELCGTNAITNLWPQPRSEAKLKDRDENRLTAAVRDGHMTLAAAQAEILRLWGGGASRGSTPAAPAAG